MKKFLIGLLIFFVLLIAAMAILPSLYKEEIKAKIDSEIAKTLDAEVFWDIDRFSVSLFRRFPNLDVEMDDFGVVGKGDFEGDTLAYVEEFHLVLDIMSVIRGDKMVIKGITMDRPNIYAVMLENGKANWDIMKVDTTATTQAEINEETAEFNLRIKKWEINDGQIIYVDETLPMYMLLTGVSHKGSGDFTQDVLDMETHTEARSINVEFDGVKYIENKKLNADMTMNINLPEFRYTFKENIVRINELAISFDGFLAMPHEDIDMDIAFASKDNDFKSVLSLVPGMYKDDFEDIEASGEMSFDGFFKGVFSADTLNPQMPAFAINLLVKDGMFKYPDLPTPVKNVNTDMHVTSPDGDMEKLEVMINSFHMEMGSNPVDAKAHIKGMTNMFVDANVKAAVNLAEVTQIFPMEGMELKGNFNLDGNAKGIYNDSLGKMPAMDAVMSLSNGYVKSSEFPEPMQDMRFNATVNNPTGEMKDFKMLVENFHMMLQQEEFNARLALENFDDYTYDLSAKGTVDLERITKIYPLEDMTLTGKLIADIDTRGKMSDIDAERYDRLPTSGTASLRNFTYASPDLQHPFNISEADMNFDPAKMNLTKFNGSFGSTQMNMSGSVSNYIAYALKDDATLKGNMDFKSPKVNVNEFMADDEAATSNEPEAETPLSITR